MSEQLDREEVNDDEDIVDFLSNAEVSSPPGTKLEDVVGIQAATEKMKEYIILPAKFPQLFGGSRRPHSVGLLLYGPPGAGKTLLVQATIAELSTCNALCFKISAYDLISRWQKTPLKAFIFDLEHCKKAESYTFSVIFIDDIEVLGNEHGQTEMCKRLQQELRVLTYDFHSKWRDAVLSIVGVTNKPWKLANAFLLRRMFDKRVYTPLPDSEARCALFKQQLSTVQHSLSEEDFRMLGERSVGLSGADISVVARDSSMQPIRKVQAATHFKHICGPSSDDPNKMVDDLLTPCSRDDPEAIEMNWTQIDAYKLAPQSISMDDVMKSMSTQKPSVSKEELDMYEQFKEEWGT